MAGGLTKYRHLSRNSAQRQALLRNLVTSLVKTEKIHTSWHKAKEAQRLADKLITLAKRNNETARRQAQGILYTPHLYMDKLFGELRERYLLRPGGYTRVLRTETKNTYSQEQSAILEYVDNARDTRFNMAAMTVARHGGFDGHLTEITRTNMRKAVQFRPHGHLVFREVVRKMKDAAAADGNPEPSLTQIRGAKKIARRVEDLGRLEAQRVREVRGIRERAGLKPPQESLAVTEQVRIRMAARRAKRKTAGTSTKTKRVMGRASRHRPGPSRPSLRPSLRPIRTSS